MTPARPAARPRLARALARPALFATATLLLSAAPSGAPSAAPSGDEYSDDRFGFAIDAPRKWEPIPIPTGEGWLVAKFLSDKTYYYNSDGWSVEFRPEMLVIAFISDEILDVAEKAKEKELEEKLQREAEKGSGDDEDEDGDGEDDGEGDGGDDEGGDDDGPAVGPNEFLLRFGRRYKDYKDYLKSTYSGGGYYFSAEETGEHDGIPVTKYQVKVEKLARTGPKRIVTWIYHLQDVDVAVQFEVLEDDYEDLDRHLDRSFESLDVIERTAELPDEQYGAGTTVRITFGDLEELSPEQRRKKRLRSEEQQHAAAIANLTEGWAHERMGPVMVLSHADKRYDKRVVDQAEAVLEFLGDNFDYVGVEEYVRAPIVRICEDYDEEIAFRRGGGAWSFNNLEITTNKEGGGTRSFEFEWLNRRLVDHWFNEKDYQLWAAMPGWLRMGITNLVAESTEKRGKLDFYRDQWTMQTLRELDREGGATHARDLVHMGREDFMGAGGQTSWDRSKESQLLVEFLLVGRGSRGKHGDLIHDYIRNLREVVDGYSTETITGIEDEPETEQEEEAALRRRNDAWRNRERAILEDVSRRTFEGWDERDWDKLDRDYRRSL